MKTSILDSLKTRHTNYTLSKESTLKNNEIVELIKEATSLVPSAFNSQSQRVVVVFKQEHDKVWKITENTLKKIVPAEKFANTKARIDGFANAYGTVLFFDETAITNGLAEQLPSFAENFTVWAQQHNGMLQLVVWSVLAENGLAASLQHYNPLIDEEILNTFDLPKTWKLIAQMPFGVPSADAEIKPKVDITERVFVK